MQSMRDRFLSSLQGAHESVRMPSVRRVEPLGMGDINMRPTRNGNVSYQQPEQPEQQTPQAQQPAPEPTPQEQAPVEEMSLDDQALMDAARSKDIDALQRGLFSLIARYQ